MILRATRNSSRGFTLAELVTVLGVLVVLTAIAVPTWRTHTLRVRRTEAIEALTNLHWEVELAVVIGRTARYATTAQLVLAPPEGLGLATRTAHGAYRVELRTADDGLSYLASARVSDGSGQSADTRCVEFSIDHNGRRRANDAEGVERNADCWQ